MSVSEEKLDANEEKIVDEKTDGDELKNRILELEKSIEDIKKESDKKCLEFIEKKTKEAVQIIAKKEKEIEDKYRKELDEKIKYKYEKPFSDLVEIVSQFEKVIFSITDPSVSNYLLGFKMFSSKFFELFLDFGINEISVSEGDEFNSEVMEASKVSVVKDKNLDNKIVGVLAKGYQLYDRVIKLAQVEVGRLED